jgi:hypothetical protein
MDYGTSSGWIRESPSHEVTDSLGGRSTQRRVEITHDQGAAWRSLSKWYSLVRPLGRRVPLTAGLCYRPAICHGHLIMMLLSAEPRGGSQCLRVDGELWYPWGHERVSLVRCSREITGQRIRRALGTTAVAEY